jgi:hypothetical protein
MRYAAVITFEFEVDAPETVRTVVEAGNVHTAASRAVRAARRALPRRRPSSIVLLLEPEREG